MGAATDLGAALHGAIADSESLIVVCSPSAAQSRWVNEEVIHFKRTGRVDRIFAVIVDGVPNAPPTRTDQECFSPALRFELGPDGLLTDRPAEPLGLDIRKESFSKLTVRLAAGLVRMPFDALWRREQRRARTRIAMGSLAASALAVILGGAATQNLWRPPLDAYLRYARYAHSAGQLIAAPPGATFQDCQEASSDCPVMVVIPEGRFVMGSPEGDPDYDPLFGPEFPEREVTIARFAVSQNEITFADWQACAAGGGCRGVAEPADSGWGRGSRPVINVSWEEAQEYVRWLSQVTGAPYRLLTEAE